MTGYRNLIHMVSCGFSEGFYMKPRIDMELLRAHSEGLICLSACLAGAIPRALADGDMDGAYDLCEQFLDIFNATNDTRYALTGSISTLKFRTTAFRCSRKSMRVCTSFPES